MEEYMGTTGIKGKWALLTGASRGVGARVAGALAEKGCKLILQSRTLDGTKKMAEGFKAKGIEAHSVAAELSDPAQVQRLIAEAGRISGGHIDILYNNAGIMTKYREKIYDATTEEYAMSFMVNVITPAMICNAFIPKMVERGWGRVVNVTSGIADEPQLMAYSCSKAALDRYVRDMVKKLDGTGVLINLMDPGWLRTDLGGPQAPNDPDSVLPGAMVPVLLDNNEGSGKTYHAMDYVRK
jgi:NAD(P)-dependent dehydrogenase (short-subunit alcohol dehydrogenase family)